MILVNAVPERILRGVISFEDSYSKDLDEINKQQQEVQKYSDFVSMEMQKKLRGDIIVVHASLLEALGNLERPFDRMEQNTKEIRDTFKEFRDDRILDWISEVPYNQYHRHIFQKVVPGTGHWIQQIAPFQKWQSCSYSKIFWLHGMVGSGKSSCL